MYLRPLRLSPHLRDRQAGKIPQLSHFDPPLYAAAEDCRLSGLGVYLRPLGLSPRLGDRQAGKIPQLVDMSGFVRWGRAGVTLCEKQSALCVHQMVPSGTRQQIKTTTTITGIGKSFKQNRGIKDTKKGSKQVAVVRCTGL